MPRASARVRAFLEVVEPQLDGDPVGLELLAEVVATIQLLEGLRAQIRREGLSVKGSMGQPKTHGAVREVTACQLVLDRLLERLRVRLDVWSEVDELARELSTPVWAGR